MERANCQNFDVLNTQRITRSFLFCPHFHDFGYRHPNRAESRYKYKFSRDRAKDIMIERLQLCINWY